MPSGREINSTQRKERRVLITLDNAGAIIAGGEHATSAVNGTGDRTLTLARPAARAVTGMVSALEADTAGFILSGTVQGLDVNITDLAGTAADKSVLVEIVAYDSEDEI